MKKPMPATTFGEQMAQSMAELRNIMDTGESPTANGRLTARTIEVTEPSAYDAAAVKRIRDGLNVSQAIFARLVGVSDVLVRSWEQGVREPAPVARRLLDQIRAHPGNFTQLVRSQKMASAKNSPRRNASLVK